MSIDIHDWKGNELINEFIDYVNTGTANAKAIASQDSKSMVNSVRIEKILDGYRVIVDPSVVKRLSGKKFYYPYIYSEVGYTHHPSFRFVYEGFMNIGESRIGNGTSWSAIGGQGRKGSGTSNIRGIKIAKRVRKLD